MFVPLPDGLSEALAGGGRLLFAGVSDVGKTTTVMSAARAACVAGQSPMVVDIDMGQSEIGPSGMMDLAETLPDKPAKEWRIRGQWYIGANTPFSSMVDVVTGAGRLADRAEELGGGAVLVDTPSFVNTPAGHTLERCLVDILRPRAIVAIQRGDEMERWLAGIGAPVVRITADSRVRVKPAELRAARRGTGLGAYLREAQVHTLSLLQMPLRGTRLGFGKPLTSADHRIASPLLGCPVLHAERGPASVAFWTLGPPRHPLDRVAAEFGVRQAVTFDGSFWSGRSVGFIGPDGFCLAMGVVERVDWPSMTASVRAPVYSVAEAVAVHAGIMRCRSDGTGLPDVPERDA